MTLKKEIQKSKFYSQRTQTRPIYGFNAPRSQPQFNLVLTMASIASRRLRKELQEIQTEGCPVGKFYTHISLPSGRVFGVGIKVLKADDFETWLFSIEVMGESQYQVRSSEA